MDQAHNMHERGLARTARSDQENKIATIESQVDIMQNFRTLSVAHGDLFKLQHDANDRSGRKRNDCGVYTLRRINPANSQPLRERHPPGLL